MLKNKSIDYIFGMITGASLMVAFGACTSDVTASSGDKIEIDSSEWNPVYVKIVD